MRQGDQAIDILVIDPETPLHDVIAKRLRLAYRYEPAHTDSAGVSYKLKLKTSI